MPSDKTDQWVLLCLCRSVGCSHHHKCSRVELDELQVLLHTSALGVRVFLNFLLASVQLMNWIDFSTFCPKNRLIFVFGFVLFFFPQNIHVKNYLVLSVHSGNRQVLWKVCCSPIHALGEMIQGGRFTLLETLTVPISAVLLRWLFC